MGARIGSRGACLSPTGARCRVGTPRSFALNCMPATATSATARHSRSPRTVVFPAAVRSRYFVLTPIQAAARSPTSTLRYQSLSAAGRLRLQVPPRARLDWNAAGLDGRQPDRRLQRTNGLEPAGLSGLREVRLLQREQLQHKPQGPAR